MVGDAALAEIVMPKLGLTMTEGLLTEWRVRPGARVTAGEVLFVVETEKIATDVEAPGEGEIRELLVPAGSTVPVGAPVARWTGSAPPAERASAEPAGTGARQAAAPAVAARAAAAEGRILATPLARRLARERGVALGTLRGSGPRGRIKACDVPQAAAAGSPRGTPPPAEAATPRADAVPRPDVAAPQPGGIRPLDRVRAAAARRLTRAKQEIPHFYLGAAAEISRFLALREEWNALPGVPRITLTHAVLAAVGRALLALPACNRVWEEPGWRQLAAPDVGLAVDTPRGLFAPVLRDAGRLPLDALAAQAAALVARARDGRLAAEELEGGSVTVSNVGMHGGAVRFLVPVINPGQAMILGVGAAEPVFRPDERGAPALRRELTLVLAADHRVLDGAEAAGFLARVVALLERPLALLRSPIPMAEEG